MKTKTKTTIKAIISLVLVIVLVVGIGMWANLKLWNDGVCPNDGTKWTFLDVERGKTTQYFYKCEKCGNIIQVSFEMESLDFTETSNSGFYND